MKQRRKKIRKRSLCLSGDICFRKKAKGRRMKFKEYLQDSYRSFDIVKPPRKKNVSGIAAPIEIYNDPLDPSKVKHKTKKIVYGTII
jgi:hypothetical protein